MKVYWNQKIKAKSSLTEFQQLKLLMSLKGKENKTEI